MIRHEARCAIHGKMMKCIEIVVGHLVMLFYVCACLPVSLVTVVAPTSGVLERFVLRETIEESVRRYFLSTHWE